MKRLCYMGIAAVLPAALLVLSGCGPSHDRTTFVLNRDGSATQYIIDTAYADTGIGELREYVENSLSAYQGEEEEARIELEKCDIHDGYVDIELSYASCADYAAYNDVVCFDGTLSEAEAAGYDLDTSYRVPEGNAVSYAQIRAYETEGEVRVLIMNEVTAAELPGDVLAFSSNVQAEEDGTLSTVPDTDESVPEEFRTINYENAYFIYEL